MSRQVNLGQIVPNIRIGNTTTTSPGTNANVENVGTELNPILNFYIPKGEPGAINLLIVNELPQVGRSDTLYFVPKEDAETSDLYDEYVWIDNKWELIGEKQITIDLSDYYTKQEVNNLIPTQLSELNSDSTHRTVSDTEKSTWNDKVDTSAYNSKMTQIDTSLGNKANISDIPTKTSDLTNDSDFTTKTYVDGLVGDIDTALDLINGEVIS